MKRGKRGEAKAGATPGDAPGAKKSLRAEMKERLRAVGPFARERRSRAAAAFAVRSPALARAGLVLAYRAMPDEIDADPLVRALEARGVRVVFPRVDGRGALGLFAPPAGHALAPAFFTRDRYGILSPDPGAPGVQALEPVQVDAVVVPGRAFDARGARLGRGKGFYDGLIARLRPDARAATLGLCHAEQLVETVPEDAHDRRVAWIATDRSLLRARPAARA